MSATATASRRKSKPTRRKSAAKIESKVINTIKKKLDGLASKIRSHRLDEFDSWMEVSKLLKQAKDTFAVKGNGGVSAYHDWAKAEFNFGSLRASRFTELHGLFGHYSRDIRPYADLDSLLELANKRCPVKVRKWYTRQLTNGKYTPSSSVRGRIADARGKKLPEPQLRYTLQVDGIHVLITTTNGSRDLSTTVIRNRIKKAIENGAKVVPQGQRD
jgi:hypothetical protein